MSYGLGMLTTMDAPLTMPGYGQYSEAVPSRRLMTHLLHCLSVHGWHLSISTDLSKKSYDKDTLFFRHGPPLNRMFFSVSFNEYDKIRIIDPPTEQIKNAFVQAVQVGACCRPLS